MIALRVVRNPLPRRDHRHLVAVPDHRPAGLAAEMRRIQPLRVEVAAEVLPGQRRHVAAMRTGHVVVLLRRALESARDPAGADDLRRRDPHDLRILEARGAARRQLFRVTLRRHLELRHVIHQHEAPRRAGEVVGRACRGDLQRAGARDGLLIVQRVGLLPPAVAEDLPQRRRRAAHRHPLRAHPFRRRRRGRMHHQAVERTILVPGGDRRVQHRDRLAPLRRAAHRHLAAGMLGRQHLVDAAQERKPVDPELPGERRALVEDNVVLAPARDVGRRRRHHREGEAALDCGRRRRQEPHQTFASRSASDICTASAVPRICPARVVR